MYSYINEHKKAKGVNRNVVATISHNRHKDKLLNNKFIRDNDHRKGTYEINKISLSFLMAKYISKQWI